MTFHGTLDARPEGVEHASVRSVWMNQGSGGMLVVKEKEEVEGSMVEAANGPKLPLSKEHSPKFQAK